jgi:hypothetical protein
MADFAAVSLPLASYVNVLPAIVAPVGVTPVAPVNWLAVL